MGEYWDDSPPHPCERLGRQEGQSNFLSLLAGVEAGPDTTEDAAALAFVDCGLPPEILVAKWAGSSLYKPAICQLVFDVMDDAGDVPERDRLWVKAAILDAFAVFTQGYGPNGRLRAKRFKVGHEPYYATRKFALAMLQSMAAEVERAWIVARFG
jgi:hypothetical protein